jgi:hypothetical protein
LKRGPKQHGYSDESVETRIAEFFGGIKERIILFSAETGISAGWVAERISTLLSPERERVLRHMSIVQLASTGNGGSVEPLALAVDAHQREAQSPTVGTTGEAATNKTIKKKLTSSGWNKLTPEERSKEMVRRRKVAKRNKELKAAGKLKKPWKRTGISVAKQKRYLERSHAKALGLPMPPLPGDDPNWKE